MENLKTVILTDYNTEGDLLIITCRPPVVEHLLSNADSTLKRYKLEALKRVCDKEGCSCTWCREGAYAAGIPLSEASTYKMLTALRSHLCRGKDTILSYSLK